MGFILPPEMERYIEEHTSPQDEVLHALDRETHLHQLMPQMLSGRVQGRFLEMMSKMIGPERILEVGTFTGYSAICLARGLKEGGRLITIDINEELEDTVRSYIRKAGMEDRIDFRIGDARQIIDALEGPFDLVFLDADKENYLHYYEQAMPKLRTGGYILADNVLWSGKVITGDDDPDTVALREYSEAVQRDERVENVLLSVRDGIMIARKVAD